jgi:drug/metabolite transporter (DMT)-like permease
MLTTGILFALGTTFCWSIGIFPFTQAARRLGNNSLNHFRLLVACIVIGLFAFIAEGEKFTAIFSDAYKNSWLWLGLSGIVGLTIGDYFAFAMYSILGARTGSILTTFAPAAALILGAIIVDERISIVGITGIMITIAGVNFISFGKSEREKLPDHGHGSIAWGIIAGILGALCQGAGLVLAKKGMLSQPSEFPLLPINATFIRLSSAIVSLIIFSVVSGQIKKVIAPVITNKNNGIKYALAGAFFGPILGVTLSLYAVSLIDPSVAQTIFSLVPAFAFFLSAIIFKEKITAKAILGLLVAIAGVIILIWRDSITNLI